MRRRRWWCISSNKSTNTRVIFYCIIVHRHVAPYASAKLRLVTRAGIGCTFRISNLRGSRRYCITNPALGLIFCTSKWKAGRQALLLAETVGIIHVDDLSGFNAGGGTVLKATKVLKPSQAITEKGPYPGRSQSASKVQYVNTKR